jgi:lysophospholipase L1-like esterase
MMKNSLFCLFVIIGIDGPDPLRFKENIDALIGKKQVQKIEPGGIMFLGSSSIRMWESLEKDFEKYPVYNLGFGGSHISDVLYYFEDLVLPFKPSLIVFYEGDNDLASGKSPEQVFHDFKEFHKLIKQDLPGIHIGFIAVKPSPSRWHLRKNYELLNQKILSYSLEVGNITFIDIYSHMIGPEGRPIPSLYLKDSLHMTPEGYDLWEKMIRPFIEKRFTPSNKTN